MLPSDIKQLSKREWEVAGLLASGYSIQFAADKLGVSHHTLESHRGNIYRKWRVRDREHLKRTYELIRKSDLRAAFSVDGERFRWFKD